MQNTLLDLELDTLEFELNQSVRIF